MVGPDATSRGRDLDNVLCPNLFATLIDEDWGHNVQEDFKLHLFRDLDHVLKRVGDKAVNVLALIEEPTHSEIEAFHDSRFDFCGFDLVEVHGGISALTNCKGFDKAFSKAELSETGLLLEHRRAVDVRTRLAVEYPDEPHAICHVWAIWRMKRD